MSGTNRRLGRRPGDLARAAMIERILRVDQAGEQGAVRIYQGQLAVLGRSQDARVLGEMLAAETDHLNTFNRLLLERRARPTVLSPLWHVAGFALGAGTALIGRGAAMACTAAVEEVIEEHYAGQADWLAGEEAEGELKRTIEAFGAEETRHKETAQGEGAGEAPAHEMLSGAIKAGTRLAIWLSERI